MVLRFIMRFASYKRSIANYFYSKVLRYFANKIVHDIYQGVLRREPDELGESIYIDLLKNASNLVTAIKEVAGSEEFWQLLLQLHRDEIVEAVYQGLLLRGSDEVGQNTYTKQFKTIADLSEILRQVALSKEHRQLLLSFDQIEVIQQLYQKLIQRNLSPVQKDLYLDRLKKGDSIARIAEEIVNSQEYLVSKKVVVFLHVQKTGGTSLNQMFRVIFGSNFCGGHFTVNVLEVPKKVKAGIKCISGHYDFDSLENIKRIKPLSLITFVRNPSHRLVSLYHFLAAHKKTDLNPKSVFYLAKKFQIEEFFLSGVVKGDSGFWNHMTWVIMGNAVWTSWNDISREFLSEDFCMLVDKVFRPIIRQRLSEFFFVGVQENFDESVSTLFRMLDVESHPAIAKEHSLEKLVNINESFNSSYDLEKRKNVDLKIFDSYVQIDNVLYEEAVLINKRFIETLKNHNAY